MVSAKYEVQALTQVEEILDCRKVDGRLQYLIKWKDYSCCQNTWEPVSNLVACKRLLKEYRKQHIITKSFFGRSADLKIGPAVSQDVVEESPEPPSPSVSGESNNASPRAKKVKIEPKVEPVIAAPVDLLLERMHAGRSEQAPRSSICINVPHPQDIMRCDNPDLPIILMPIIRNPPRRELYDASKPLLCPKREFEPGTPHQDAWIQILKKSLMEIKVTNTLDDEGPPTSFKWVEDYVLRNDIPVIDLDATPGCACAHECSIMADSQCQCIVSQDYGSSYDEFGCVRFGPQQMAIFECNLNCSCSIQCPNR